MARIRTIKPEFWSSEQVTSCSRDARLLFIGTWNHADDEGNLARSASQLKAKVFPADEIECEPLLQELLAHGLLIEYSVSDKVYLHIDGFKKHQLINRPSKPQCPLYEDSLRTHGVAKSLIVNNSLSTHGALTTEGRKEGREGGDLDTSLRSVSQQSQVVVLEKQRIEEASNEGTRRTWTLYAVSYEKRYGVAPVRNAKVNSLLKQLVARLGADDAAAVAAFYVGHDLALYVRGRHPVELLLRDAEGLRTQWATGKKSTGLEARSAEQREAVRSQVDRVAERLAGEKT